MGSILVGRAYQSPYLEWRCYYRFGRPSPACLKESAVQVNSEAVMQTDDLLNYETLLLTVWNDVEQ